MNDNIFQERLGTSAASTVNKNVDLLEKTKELETIYD